MWSGFGKPLPPTLPSLARPKNVSKKVSVSRAGRNWTRVIASSGLGFHQTCGVPAGTTAVSPGW
jgi:hypothetical protein